MTGRPDPGSWTRQRLRDELASQQRPSAHYLFLPGPDAAINPEGCIVTEHRDGRVRVYNVDRGNRDVRWFDDEAKAIEYVIRRYVWWEDV